MSHNLPFLPNYTIQIEVRVMTVRDYEHQLRMEISENENRKEFTFSERVDWARRLERIEKEKARERQSVLNGKTELTENFPEAKGETRDIVADASGFGSGRQYEKAKYIADHAYPEIIAKLDADKISIHRAYQETKRMLAEAERRAVLCVGIRWANARLRLRATLERIPHSFREFPNRSPAFLRLTTRGRVNVPGRWNNARNGGADRGKRENCGHARWACVGLRNRKTPARVRCLSL